VTLADNASAPALGTTVDTALVTALATADWRRRVFALYAHVREATDLAAAHDLWRRERDRLFAEHPASPLLEDDKKLFSGLPVKPYDPDWRFEVAVTPIEPRRMDVPTATDGVVPFDLIGVLDVPGVGSLDLWRLASYGGGLFLPIKDALAGTPKGTYGGGRYLLDTVKGADLGQGHVPRSLVLDFNFAYNPSCAYDPAWACPLAQAGNTVAVDIPAGERYSGQQ
jgi:uncharacterized protein (DUF1684 family)